MNMYSLQIRGPRRKGEKYTVHLSSVYKVVKIGVNRPHCTPIQRYESTGQRVVPQIAIDGVTYAIMDNDILEYEGLYESTTVINFLVDIDPFTVIDLIFIDVDD